MKTIKNEMYKGYKIEVKAEFKEGTSAQTPLGRGIPTIFFDSIKLQLTASKSVLAPPILKKSRVEENQNKRQELYDKMNVEVAIMVTGAKEEIDKKEREKEMTDGLPESLLADEGVLVTLQGGEIVLPEGVRITAHDGKYMEFTKDGVKIKSHQIILSCPELKS